MTITFTNTLLHRVN